MFIYIETKDMKKLFRFSLRSWFPLDASTTSSGLLTPCPSVVGSGTSLASSRSSPLAENLGFSACLRVFLLCILMVSVVACASTPKKRSFGEVMDDSMITNRLKLKFMKDKVVKAHQIDIDTWKGIVNLKGGVDSQKQINRAIELSERQKGVKQVKSYLVLADKPATRKAPPSSVEKQVVQEKDVKGVGGIVHDDEDNGATSPPAVIYH